MKSHASRARHGKPHLERPRDFSSRDAVRSEGRRLASWARTGVALIAALESAPWGTLRPCPFLLTLRRPGPPEEPRVPRAPAPPPL